MDASYNHDQGHTKSRHKGPIKQRLQLSPKLSKATFAVAGCFLPAPIVAVVRLVAQAINKGCGEGVLHQLARCDVVLSDLVIVGPRRMAVEVDSVPLSLTIRLGLSALLIIVRTF
jgi:hypothetical protein